MIERTVLIFAILCVVILPVHTVQGNDYGLDSTDYKKIGELSRQFHDVLKQKDIVQLSKMALPGNETRVMQMLEDEKSQLYKKLISSELNKSKCWNNFLNIKELECAVASISPGGGVTIYLYDGSKSAGDIQDLLNRCEVLSLYLLKSDKNWYVSYQYLIDEDY